MKPILSHTGLLPLASEESKTKDMVQPQELKAIKSEEASPSLPQINSEQIEPISSMPEIVEEEKKETTHQTINTTKPVDSQA